MPLYTKVCNLDCFRSRLYFIWLSLAHPFSRDGTSDHSSFLLRARWPDCSFVVSFPSVCSKHINIYAILSKPWGDFANSSTVENVVFFCRCSLILCSAQSHQNTTTCLLTKAPPSLFTPWRTPQKRYEWAVKQYGSAFTCFFGVSHDSWCKLWFYCSDIVALSKSELKVKVHWCYCRCLLDYCSWIKICNSMDRTGPYITVYVQSFSLIMH